MSYVESEAYYRKIGFRCGLEIHQRLATKHKLFCSCSARLDSGRKIGTVERRQRAVVGELGTVDVSTAFESSKGRKFLYDAYADTSCVVDLDEEPPHAVDSEAIGIALRIAAALDAEVPDEIEPMRKGVVDGSDPSAFQRSMMVGYDGKLAIGRRKITISSIFLEEESSGIIRSDNESVEYGVDRMGIPLIEIDTAPEISTPSEAKEVALRIGLLLRLTGKVQRGIGTIRQDVNVSIEGGTRVEIKGVQDLANIDLLIDNEIKRQANLIKIRDELAKKKAHVGEIIEITPLLGGTDAKVIGPSIKAGGAVFALKLAGFKDYLGREINPGRRLGTEISDYAKMAGVKGIIHSDEDLSKYGLSEAEMSKIVKALGIGSADAFVLVAAEKQTALRAMEHAKSRAEMAMSTVPGETRAALEEGLSRFMRPIPGGSRMYPETDAVPIEVSEERLDVGEKIDPDKIAKKLGKEIGNKQIAEQMLWSEQLPVYSYITEKTGLNHELVAVVLLEKFRELKREGIDPSRVGDETLVYIFKQYSEGRITKSGINELLRFTPVSAEDVDRIIEQKKLKRISGQELAKLVEGLGKGPEIVAKVMSQYRLNVDGDELNSITKKKGRK